MRNDNKLVKFTSFVLLVTIVAVSLVSGTFAKYTSTATASATATVAKWSLKVNDTEIAVTGDHETIEFDLFETILDTNTGDDDEATTGEADVKETLIAPGTQGSFALKVDNLSEVNAVYSIAFAQTGMDGVPLQYSVDGADWKNAIADINVTDAELAMENGTETITVYWQWPFEGNDTATGIAAQTGTVANKEVKVTATITATQVD